jgi:hypothetical protein
MGALVVQLCCECGQLVAQDLDFAVERLFLLGFLRELLPYLSEKPVLSLDVVLSRAVVLFLPLQPLLVLLELYFLRVKLFLEMAERLASVIDEDVPPP